MTDQEAHQLAAAVAEAMTAAILPLLDRVVDVLAGQRDILASILRRAEVQVLEQMRDDTGHGEAR